ncbi:outer membrane protein assembly factor BamD [Bartonella sp. DGB2]|uniref:outer membrane protein assembly factor BamD n=1 Tax=Bartonella sp. DGB2 TaxID=3388426 RepID=UPI00398FAA46
MDIKTKNTSQLMRARKILFSLALGSACFLAGCMQKNKPIDLTVGSQIAPADTLYAQAYANFKGGNLKQAAKLFAKIPDQNPYSEWARKALLMATYTNYQLGQYDDANNLGRRYINLYPRSDDTPYAFYLIGLASYKQIPDVSRDQTPAERTIVAMEAIVKYFPKSKYVADAKEKIRFAREQLAGKEMHIGRYYEAQNQYLAALKRFQAVIRQYADTSQVQEAMYRVVEANYALGLMGEAQRAAVVLSSKYPESIWSRNAHDLLAKGQLDRAKTKVTSVSKIFGGVQAAIH